MRNWLLLVGRVAAPPPRGMHFLVGERAGEEAGGGGLNYGLFTVYGCYE